MQLSMKLPDAYYIALEVEPIYTLDELRHNYRRKVKCYHPDLNPSPEAPEQFRFIQEAHEWLLANHKPEYENKKPRINPVNNHIKIFRIIERDKLNGILKIYLPENCNRENDVDIFLMHHYNEFMITVPKLASFPICCKIREMEVIINEENI